jgi:hypothetical protein
MTSLVYLTTISPSKIGDALIAARFEVWEALSVSEVLHLCEHHDIDVVVIAAAVVGSDLTELQLRRITLMLEPDATAADVIWELSNLFPASAETVQ